MRTSSPPVAQNRAPPHRDVHEAVGDVPAGCPCSGAQQAPAVVARACDQSPAVAAEAKSIAVKSRPLPRNTVAKKRSSASPTRSRTTPMNQRNAIPANGMIASANSTSSRRARWDNHFPASLGCTGTTNRTLTRAIVNRIAKAMPAIPAARGASEVPVVQVPAPPFYLDRPEHAGPWAARRARRRRRGARATTAARLAQRRSNLAARS